MALRAVFEIANALAQMLRPNSVGLVLVTSIAGVSAGIVADMTGRAGHVMRPLQQEELPVVEIRALPAGEAVALRTVGGYAAVNGRSGRRVARTALSAHRRIQQFMREWLPLSL